MKDTILVFVVGVLATGLVGVVICWIHLGGGI